MEKTLTTILIALALIVGIICGVVFTLSEDCKVCETCEVCEICPEPQECEVAEEVVCEDTATQLLDTAVADFLEYLDDEDELVCNEVEYNDDEVTVKKIYDDYSIVFDGDDEYIVTGKVKLNFKEDDEKRCRETFEFEVFYEEDEDPEVKILA